MGTDHVISGQIKGLNINCMGKGQQMATNIIYIHIWTCQLYDYPGNYEKFFLHFPKILRVQPSIILVD